MKAILAVALLAVCSHARADNWTGPDKTLHFAGGALIGMSAASVLPKPQAVAFGAAIGAAKELVDYRSRSRGGHHDPSFKDFTATTLGAVAGAYVPGLILSQHFIGYSMTFWGAR